MLDFDSIRGMFGVSNDTRRITTSIQSPSGSSRGAFSFGRLRASVQLQTILLHRVRCSNLRQCTARAPKQSSAVHIFPRLWFTGWDEIHGYTD